MNYRPPASFVAFSGLCCTVIDGRKGGVGSMISASPDPGAAALPSAGRILVVDDEPALLRAMSRMLTAAGYEVATAGGGMRAGGLLANAGFDVILRGLDLPGVKGNHVPPAVP